MNHGITTGKMLEQALRDRAGIWTTLKTDHAWPLGPAAVVNIILSAFYGLVMGSSTIAAHDGWKQAVASAIKVPCLFMLTLAICLPALYVVSALLGSSLSFRQVLGVLMASFLVTTVLLASFAPITAFFMLSSRQYAFIKLLNVIFFAISAGAGLAIVGGAVNSIAGGNAATYRTLLKFWFVIYAFVGTQMAWILRPFVGSPDLKFAVFRKFGGNFYTDVIETIGRLF